MTASVRLAACSLEMTVLTCPLTVGMLTTRSSAISTIGQALYYQGQNLPFSNWPFFHGLVERLLCRATRSVLESCLRVEKPDSSD